MKTKYFTIALLFVGASAFAQTSLETFYDFGRKHVTTTVSMYKADKWGDTFFFVDHDYTSADDRANGHHSAWNGTYFEIERNLNFWKDTKLKDLNVMLEYDGSSFGLSYAGVGLSYCLHAEDYHNVFLAGLQFNYFIGGPLDTVPVKFTCNWTMNNLLDIEGLCFMGFLDAYGVGSQLTVLSEPQLWYNVGALFGVENLHIGTEIECSYNFAGHNGFMCNPCLGAKWVF